MTLRQIIGDGEPVADWYETYIGIAPIPTSHPPSLKNPIKIDPDNPDKGWHTTDSKEDRKQAKNNLIEIMKRSRRQIGKPEIANVPPINQDLWREW